MDGLIKIFASAVAFVGLIYLWKLLNWAYIEPKRLERLLRKQGLKGNSYKFVYGDTKEMQQLAMETRSKPINLDDDIKLRVAPMVMKTLRKYGNECFIWRGTKPVIIITDPELVKEVLTKNNLYVKPEHPNPLIKLFAQGLVQLDKEQWSKHRKIINPAFHLEKLKLMIPAFSSSCDGVLKKWEKCCEQKGSCEIDVWPDLQDVNRDSLSKTVFGSSYQEGTKIFELQREQVIHLINALRTAYVPGWRFMPTKRNKRMKQIDREVKTSIQGIISKRLESMRTSETCDEDLLGTMLESNLQTIKEQGNKDSGLSIDEIVEECKIFYLAGQETTSVLLVWTMVLLSHYPHWQERAREEVLQVLNNQTPNFDNLNQLKIVNMIFLEVLRLYPPVVILEREPSEETKLGKMTLPAGVHITIPTIIPHHSRDVWGDNATEFNPERFSKGVANAQKSAGLYFPFGWGPRTCIGQMFAMLGAKTTMAMILRRFSFELSPSYTHAPLADVTNEPQHGAHLILHQL